MPTESNLEDLKERLDYLDEDDLIVLADVTQATIRNWRAARKGPEFVRFGNRHLYPRTGVLAFLTRHQKPTN